MHGSGVFTALAEELQALFLGGVDAPLSDAVFGELALRAFRWQFEANPVYRGFCQGRGVSPETVATWRDVPPVPTTAFKYVDLACGDPADAEATFLTSGTTGGAGARGRRSTAAAYAATALRKRGSASGVAHNNSCAK